MLLNISYVPPVQLITAIVAELMGWDLMPSTFHLSIMERNLRWSLMVEMDIDSTMDLLLFALLNYDIQVRQAIMILSLLTLRPKKTPTSD